jgi:hypothetical protein
MPHDSGPAEIIAAMRAGGAALYALLATRLKRRPGYELLTLLAPGDSGDRLVRLYSSNHDHYPPGDADIVKDDRWFRQLFTRKEPVVANDAVEIREWLPDFDEYVAMGYGSLANLPVVVAGVAVGIVNLMAPAGHFSEDRVCAVVDELPLAALAFLAHRGPGSTIDLR